MTAELRDSLAQVQELLGRATPGEWRWSMNGNIVTDPYADDCEIAAVYSEHMDDVGIPANADAIIATVNWLRENGPKLMEALDRHGAGDGEAWRSIESAPRDGSKVLLYHPGYKSAFYQRDHHPRVWVDVFRQGSWYNTAPSGQPTHWRPLPAPPTDDAARAGERGVSNA